MLTRLFVSCLLFCDFGGILSGAATDVIGCGPWNLAPNQRYAHRNCLKEKNLNARCLIGCKNGFRFPGRRKRYRSIRCVLDPQTGTASWHLPSISPCQEIKCGRQAMPRRIRYLVSPCDSVVPLGSQCQVKCRREEGRSWTADCRLKSPRRVHGTWEFKEEPKCKGITSSDPCRGKPCQNGGVCRISGAGYVCDCKPGHVGVNCEKVIALADPCLGRPCKNEGVCRTSGSSSVCDCKSGYGGATCEKDMKEVVFVADTFLKSISTISSTPSIPENTKECENKYADSNGKTRMIGRSCPPRRRKRQSGNETVDHSLSTKADILFLIDESVSVGTENFKKFTRLTQAIVSSFCDGIDIDKEKTKISVMTFDSTQHNHVDFEEGSNKAKLLTGIQNIPYNETTSGFTCLVESLHYAKDEIFKIGHGARSLDGDTRRDIILISDGCAYCSGNANVTTQMLEVAGQLVEEQISITTIMVGHEHSNECVDQMSSLSDGSRCYQMFLIESWDEVDVFSRAVESSTCQSTWKVVEACPKQ